MRPASLVTSFALLGLWAGAAHAGAALDDDAHKSGVAGAPASGPTAAPVATTGAPAALTADDGTVPDTTPVEYGVGIRLRSVYLPKPILDLFLARAAGGAHNYGVGVDLTRRRGNTELQLGFEYERITVGEGTWINRGDTVPTDESDYVLSPQDASDGSGNARYLGWFTMEFTFINHAPITKWLSFRYGGGAGIGIISGGLYHYNIQCGQGATNASPDPACVPSRFGGQGTYTDPQPGQAIEVKYDLPPVFPVINAIVGFQLKPTDKWTVNIEGGIRTLPFFGIESSYFF